MIVCLSFLSIIIGMIEAVTYYFAMNFPYKIDSILATVKGFKKLTQFIYYIGFVVILGILIGYVCLVLCWCLLGAILNPD